MTPETEFRTARDGTRLFSHHWPAAQPRAAIVIVHGLGEHLGRYAHVGPQLVDRGFDVRGTDQRGYGASLGPRAYVDSFETLLDDVEVDVIASRSLGVPMVLLGHSLGGLLALLYATSGRTRPDLLVLSSPGLRNTLPKAQIAVVNALGRLAPRLTLKNPVDPTLLSRDQSVGESYAADPLVVQKATFGFGRAAFPALAAVPSALQQLALPTLVTHGSDDRIVAPSVSEPLAELERVERVLYPDFRHEPFNEEGGTAAVATIASWIDRQLASA